MKNWILASIIFLVAISLRFYGLLNNHPFWIDEFSTATHTRTLLKHGLSIFTDKEIFFEYNNLITYSITALLFKIFGEHEWVARLPAVFFGSLIPVVIFYLGRTIFNFRVASTASLLTIFSYFQIVWSRQARSYMLLQLLILLTIYVYLKLANKNRSRVLIATFVFLCVLGVLTHSFYFLLLIAIAGHFLATEPNKIAGILKQPLTYALIGFILIWSYYLKIFQRLPTASYNNLWYYHSFLWREYNLISFLSLTGLLLITKSKIKVGGLLVFYISLHLIFINFFYGHYISKYLLPIFPLLLLGMAYAIDQISKLIAPQKFIPIIVALFIILNGDKFVFKPKQFYSVNHDFREIALIDYHQAYKIIDANKGAAVIETWSDRANWYLGSDYKPLYIFRWKNEKLSVAGQKIQRTPFTLNQAGEKVFRKNLLLIEDVNDLQLAIAKYPQGFIFIDDASLPQDVREFAEKNLKKEIYLDHYPLDDNPYSIWPATLYSWGHNKDE